MSAFLQSLTKYKHIFSLLVFFLSATYITFPLLFHMGDYVVDLGDAPLIAYIQNWVIHSFISNNIFSLFDASIYFPYKNTLAYSDVHILSALIASPILFLTQQPIAVYNFTFFSSIILVGFAMYLFSSYVTKSYTLGLFSGVLIIFSPAYMSTYIHIQVIGLQWFLFSLYFFVRFINEQKKKLFVISLLFFVAQMYNSFLPGYFILFSYLTILLFLWLYKRKNAYRIINRKNIIIFLCSLLLTLPVVVPYYQVSKQFNYTRHITEAIHLALQPEDLLFTSSFSRFAPFINSLPFNKISQNNEFKPGYLGFIFSILAIASIVFAIKQFKKKDVMVNSFLFLAFTGLVLSLGPALHLGRQTIHQPFPVPLPYAVFYYLIPGFQGLRNSARWELLFIIGLTVLIALFLNRIFKKVTMKKKVVIFCCLFFSIIAEYNFPMQFVSIPQVKEFPKVYAWLANTPQDTKIIEMPIYVWNMHPYVFDENMREYYATVHFRKMINGASGFSPPPWQIMAADLLKDFPSKTTIKQLKTMKINYVIVHKKEYDRLAQDNFAVEEKFIPNGASIIRLLKEEYNVKIIKRFGDDYVFQL